MSAARDRGVGRGLDARLAGVAVVAVVLTVVGVAGALRTARDTPGTALLAAFLGGTGLLCLAAVVGELRTRARRPCTLLSITPDGEPSTYVPYGPGPVLVPAAALLLAALLGAVGTGAGLDSGSTGGLAVAVVVVVGCVVWVAPVLAGRVRPGGVHLTPTRVVHLHQGTGWEVAWEDVRGVVPREPVAIVTSGPSAVRRTRTAPYGWSGEVRADTAVLGIATRHLTLDAATLGHVMAMCQDRLELRSRLGTEESLDLRVFGVPR